ncbi:MAG: PAS domain-containing protein, partial [Candidatus Paceibacterota bacterium]
MDKPGIFAAVATAAEVEKARAALDSAGFSADVIVAGNPAGIRAMLAKPDAPQESDGFWKTIAEYGDDAIVLMDSGCKISFASSVIRFLTGKGAETYTGANFCDHVHPDDAGAVKKTVEVLMACPSKRQSFEIRMSGRDGNWLCLDVRAANLYGIKPVDCLSLHLRDMTLKKAMHRLLFNSAEKYRLISESLLSEIILVDAKGRVLHLNEAASASMGGRPFLFINRLLSEIFPDSRAQEYMD